MAANEQDAPLVPGVHVWMVLWKAQRSLQAHALHQIASFGLGITDFAILEVLHSKGPLPVNTLGQKVMLTSGSISLGIDRLEKDGLLERRPAPDDKRVKTVHLTPKGRELIERALVDHQAAMERAVSILGSDQRATLVDLLRRLGLHAEELIREQSPAAVLASEGRVAGSERFAHLIARIPPERPVQVLDLGCSECLEGEALLAAGVGLTGVDQDEVSIRAAGRRLPNATFVCADAAELPDDWRGRFGMILIRRPDLLAQPERWRLVFGRLSGWLSAGGRVVVTTVSAGEAYLVAQWLAESGFDMTDREELPMTDEAKIMVGVISAKPAAGNEKTPQTLPKRVVKWDDNEAGPVCDLETGKCSD